MIQFKLNQFAFLNDRYREIQHYYQKPLISLKICPFVQRIAALLEAKKITYEVKYISLDNSPQWFLDISPNAQVPVLITDSGQALFESEAIAEYLDEVYPPLEPELQPEQRAIDRAWGYQAGNLYLPQCSAMRSKDKDTLKKRQDKLDSVFKKLETELSGGPYYKGVSLSNLDIAWLTVLHRAAIIEKHSGYDFLSRFPKVKLLQKSLMDSGLAEKSVPNDFEAVFTRFYLSQSTWLGQKTNPNLPKINASLSGQ